MKCQLGLCSPVAVLGLGFRGLEFRVHFVFALTSETLVSVNKRMQLVYLKHGDSFFQEPKPCNLYSLEGL